MTQPTVARTVHYKLSEADAHGINRRRDDALVAGRGRVADGAIVHVGNPVQPGDTVPLVIVRVWPGGLVNGQAILDGNDNLWVKSAAEGDTNGCWSWPPRV